MEAGLNAGVVSVRASSTPGGPEPSSVGVLDAVVDMIEKELGSRWRAEGDVRPGEWIQFEEEFRYGAGYPGDAAREEEVMSGLVYFAAVSRPPFVLCGSAVHVLDRWQSPDSRPRHVGYFYLDALRAYARRLAELPDEAAASEFTPPVPGYRTRGTLAYALSWLCGVETRDGRGNGWVTGPVLLSGHARVLAVEPERDGTPTVLATPLYVEYAQST